MILEQLLLILAQGETPKPPTTPQQPSLFQSIFPFILIFVLFYFLLIRPQKKRQREMQEQIAALKTGDKVITAGGIHGLVTNVKERSVTLKVADNVKMEFEKASVTTVIKKDGAAEAAPPASQTDTAE